MNKDLKEQCISELAFLINQDHIDSKLQEKAKLELQKRMRNMGITCQELWFREKEVMKVRGEDISNYLFCNNPTIQQLMTLYIQYYLERTEISPIFDGRFHPEHLLMLSEYHFCSAGSTVTKHAQKILRYELENVRERLEKWDINSIKTLRIIRDILEEELSDFEENVPPLFDEEDEIMNELFSLRIGEVFKPGGNWPKNELQELRQHDWKHLFFQLQTALYQSNYSYYLDWLKGRSFVKKDVIRLDRQAHLLISEVKKPHIVDYESEIFQKVLKL